MENFETCQSPGCSQKPMNGKYCSREHAPYGKVFDDHGNKKPTPQEEELERRWKRYVEGAQEIVRQIKVCRMEIAKRAIEATEFEGNGQGRARQYTIERFAVEVQIKYKTLLEWIQVYKKVIAKAPELAHLESGNFDVLRRSRQLLTNQSPKEEVLRVVSQELGSTDYNDQMRRGVKRLGTLHYFLTNKVELSQIDRELIEQCMWHCEAILQKIRLTQ